MDQSDVISVVIPIYNVEKYLDKMLQSVYHQTFKNLQVILVNDGSTDKSEEIILRYIKQYPDTAYIKQSNKGISEARNAALLSILGKYIIFLDSDDYIEEDMLEKMYNKAEKTNSNVVITGYEKVYDDSEKNLKILYNVDENKVYSSNEVMEMMLFFDLEGYTWNKLFLKKNIELGNMIFEKDRIIEDLYPVFSQISIAEKIVFINEPLYKYRQRETSILHSNKIKKIIEDQNYAYKMMADLMVKQKKIRKGKYFRFISFVQASQIEKYVNINGKYCSDIYEKCRIVDISFKDILKSKADIRTIIKLLAFKYRVLHLFFYIRKFIRA